MLQRGRHYIVVKTADGRVRRWSPDELDSRRQYQNLRFGKGLPGFYLTMSVRLPTDIDLKSDDTEGFNEIWVKLPGGEVVWEGYISAAPAAEDENGAFAEVEAIGWNGALKDEAKFQEIFVHRDLTKWTGPSGVRKAAMGVFKPHRMMNEPNQSLGSISLEVEGNWASGIYPIAEAWFDAGPKCKIAQIWYTTVPRIDLTSPFTNWEWYVGASADEGAVAAYRSSNFAGAIATGRWTPAAPLRYGYIELLSVATPGGSAGMRYQVQYALALYGNHGLNLYGSEPKQVRIRDAVAYSVRKAAPPQITVLDSDVQDPANTLAGHLVVGLDEGGVDADAAVQYLNRMVLNDWGVKKNRRFFWLKAGTYGRTWVVRRDEGVELEEDGVNIEDVFDRALVSYTDAAGKTRTVGPPGSGADTESALLVTTVSSNLAVKHARPRMARIDAGAQILSAVAITIGQIFLYETNLQTTAGDLSIPGDVRMLGGGDALFPPSLIDPGDEVIVADDDNPRPRRITSTDYSDDEYQVNLTLDAPPRKIEALLEQLQVDLVGRV